MQKQMLGEVRTWTAIWWYHEYLYQKLLKLDNPSSRYGKKIFGVFLCLTA